MSIKNLKYYISVDGILNQKRKNNIYSVLENIPVEIDDIDISETSVIAIELKNHQNKTIITEYISYNNELYEPWVENIDLIDENSLEKCNNEKYKIDEFKLPYYKQKGETDTFSLTEISKHGEVKNIEDFKKIFSNNKTKSSEIISNKIQNLICINNEIYKKTMGPILGMKNQKNLRYFIPSYMLFTENFNTKNHEYGSYMQHLTLDMIDLIQDQKQISEHPIDTGYYIFNLDFLQKNNYKINGRKLFEVTLGNYLSWNIKRKHRYKETDVYELQRKNFLDKIYKKYSFGSEFKMLISLCEQNNYDFNDVYNVLNFISKNLEKFDKNSNTIQSNQNIHPTFFSDFIIMQSLILDYSPEELMRIKKSIDNKSDSNLILSINKNFYKKRHISNILESDIDFKLS